MLALTSIARREKALTVNFYIMLMPFSYTMLSCHMHAVVLVRFIHIVLYSTKNVYTCTIHGALKQSSVLADVLCTLLRVPSITKDIAAVSKYIRGFFMP